MALAAIAALGVFLSACGSSDSIPDNAVATVDGTPITKADFERWQQITAKGATQGNPTAVVPDPPAYTNCVAGLRKQSKPAKGKPKPTDASLLAQCKAQEQQVQQQTMATLIQTAWVEGEAKKQGVTVNDSAVQQQLAQTRKQSFPTAAAYNKFLATSGMTQADVLDRVRVQLLAQRITPKQRQKMAAFITDFQKRWKDKTNCRAGYVVPLCSNAPTPTATPSTPPPAQSGGSAAGSGK